MIERRTLRQAINWLATLATWLTAPFLGGVIFLFLWQGLLGITGSTPEIFFIPGAWPAAWCAVAIGVLFMHRGWPSKLIHLLGCVVLSILPLLSNTSSFISGAQPA